MHPMLIGNALLTSGWLIILYLILSTPHLEFKERISFVLLITVTVIGLLAPVL